MKKIFLLYLSFQFFAVFAQKSDIVEANEDINCEGQVYNTRELIPFAFNAHCKAESYPFVSDDGDEMYFTSDQSYHWLFYTQKDSISQIWSVPLPIQIANYKGNILSAFLDQTMTQLYFTNQNSEVYHCSSIGGSKTQFVLISQVNFQNSDGDQNRPIIPFSSLSFSNDFMQLYANVQTANNTNSAFVSYTKVGDHIYAFQTVLSSFNREVGFLSSDGLRYYFTTDDVKNVLFCQTRKNIKEIFSEEIYYVKKFEPHLKITQCRMAEKSKQLAMVLCDEKWDRNDIYFYNIKDSDTLKLFNLRMFLKDRVSQKEVPTPLYTADFKTEKGKVKSVEILNQAGADLCKIEVGVPFPNPAKNQFSLYYNVIGDNLSLPLPVLQICSLSGEVLYSQRLENTCGQVLVSPEHINPGSYYVRIEYHGVYSANMKITLSFS